MGARWVSGFVAVLFALTVTLLGGWYFTAALGLIIFLAQLEFFRLVRAKGNAPAMRTTMLSSQVLVILQQVKARVDQPCFYRGGIHHLFLFAL
jgi:phosphatidate cytidylyltransferase